MDALVSFAATLLAFRLAGQLVSRHRATGRPELLAWGCSLAAYARHACHRSRVLVANVTRP